MPMREATWRPCPGLAEGKFAHSMRDGCWSCAPFWEYFPACPHCGGKLMKTGKTKCRGCGKFALVRPLVRVPLDFAVQPLMPGEPAAIRMTCGTCGLAWDDGKVTSLTPAPSARCPFEAFHNPEEESS